MTRVIQIDGAPGVGKTTRLMDELASAVEQGLTAGEFWYLTFTRSGKEDAKEQLPGVPPGDEEVDPGGRVRTLHSLALRLASRDGIVEWGEPDDDQKPILKHNQDREDGDPYAEFCDRQGMRYDPNAADSRKLLSGEANTDYVGNQLFALNDFLTQTAKPAEQYQDAPLDLPIAGDRVTTLLDAWDQFKRRGWDYRLFEHGDYVREVVDHRLAPAGRLMLIDEFQDFAPLEYQAFKTWRDRGSFETIYIAGDPNQSIYSFRGGTPHYFQNTDVLDRITLKQSYRCPAEIAGFANAVLSAHPATDPEGFRGRESGGRVEHRPMHSRNELRSAVVRAAERHADAEAGVMLLTRTRYQLGQILEDLKQVGVPFTVLGTYPGVWRGRISQQLAMLNNWSSGGEEFALANVRKVVWDLPDTQERVDTFRERTGAGGVCTRKEIAPALAGYGSAVEIAEDLALPNWQRDILINAIKAPAYLSPGEVRVGTIHAAKGLEAPAVFLFTNTSKRMVRRYKRDNDLAAEEHRAYYVGATRASDELHLVDGYFDSPTAPPIERARRGAGGNVGAVA